MKLETMAAFVRSLPPVARLAGATVLVAIVAGALVWSIASHVPRAPLFATPLHPEQLTEVEEALAQWTVPFTPTSDNVIVDDRGRGKLLLRLSLAGIPHAHVDTTTEALQNVGVLTPEAVVEAQTRSGLAGDIELGLRSIEGVNDARVIVAPSKPAEFADETPRDASASVRLQMQPGSTLSGDAIAGIRHFVAASVPGLDPSHVMILDDHGIALDAAAAADPDVLARSLQSALDAALGSGTTIVRIHAEYAGAATESRDIRRLPLAGAPIQRSDATESYDGDGKRYEKRDEHDDRGSETHEIVSRAEQGRLVRLLTAIFVDTSRVTDLLKVRELAAGALGYDPRRGDRLVVQAMPFHRTLVAKRDIWFLLYGAVVPLLPIVALVAGCILVARIATPAIAPIFTLLYERTAIERASRAVAGYAPAKVRGALAHEPPHAAAAIISALPTATAAAVLELYPQHEREAIVRRMQRVHSPLIPDADEVLAHHA